MFREPVRARGPIAQDARQPRFASGTGERSKHEVRAMLAASAAMVPAPRIVLIAPRAVQDPTLARDAAIVAVLDAPLSPGETAHAGCARKEA